MKYLIFISICIAGLSCNQASTQAQQLLDPNAFETMLSQDKSAQLVDVRTPEEYAEGHIDGAKLINYYDNSFGAEIAKLDKSKPVMVYCASGGRSGSTAKKLSGMGFGKVYDLDGGMNAWRSAGKKTAQ